VDNLASQGMIVSAEDTFQVEIIEIQLIRKKRQQLLKFNKKETPLIRDSKN